MSTKLTLLLLTISAVLPAQRRVDPTNVYHRVICVTPLIGTGAPGDPTRPKYAPWPLQVQKIAAATASGLSSQDTAGIIAFSFLPSDDGKFAIVEFVARSRSAFDAIFHDSGVQVFEKGRASRAEIELAMQRYRKGFNLEQFGTVMP